MEYQPRRRPRHETVHVRGVPLHVTRWGPDDRAPLMFLHGWADTSDTFQFLVDEFVADHAIVAPDWRGFGRSGWNRAPYWFPDYLADLDALLDHYVPDGPATLLGHSMGGNVAALYSGVRPERVARFVNLEGFGMPRKPSSEAPDRYRRWLDDLKSPPAFGRFESVEQFAKLLQRKNPRLTPERAAFVARAWSMPLDGGGCTVAHDPAHKLVNPVLYRRDEAEACWSRGEAPTLLVLGGRSDYREHLREDGTDEYFYRVFRDVRIATLPEAGHMLHHEDPAAVAALVEEFLAATPERRS
jgi:pimeloyl-ACP methyl ester carboxylesterase